MKFWISPIVFIVLFIPLSRAQIAGKHNVTGLEAAILREGFENVAVLLNNDTVRIIAENRRYRFDPKGYAHLINTILPFVSAKQVICIGVLKNGIPLITVYAKKSGVKPVETDTNSLIGKVDSLFVKTKIPRELALMSRKTVRNPVYNKFEFVIYPQIKIQLGNFDDPFKSQFNIAPSLEVTFARGLRFIGQIILPIQNDLEPHGNQIRPGILSLNQFIRLPGNILTLISAGYFTRNRYGLNTEFRKYFLNGRIISGINCGYTGYAEIYEGAWKYSGISLFTFFADGGYRIPKYDLTLKAGFGRFTDGNPGWRVDTYRQFREITVGFFALSTNGFMNGGFYFRIPLPPSKYGTRSFARIRPESYFSYEYRARGLSEAGKNYSAGSTIPDFFSNINPDFFASETRDELINHK